jgi:hypothetical protein
LLTRSAQPRQEMEIGVGGGVEGRDWWSESVVGFAVVAVGLGLAGNSESGLEVAGMRSPALEAWFAVGNLCDQAPCASPSQVAEASAGRQCALCFRLPRREGHENVPRRPKTSTRSRSSRPVFVLTGRTRVRHSGSSNAYSSGTVLKVAQ